MVEEAKTAPKKERKVKTPAEAPAAAPAPVQAAATVVKKGGPAKGMYHYIGEAWKDVDSDQMKKLMWQRMVDWRKEETFVRVPKPLRLDKARALGYKAKQGFVIVRARVRRAA